MSLVEVRIPDLGDSKGVTVVDVLVKTGAQVRIDDPLITLETEKASMDVPSPVSGVVSSVDLKKGAEVSAGALIATVEVAEAGALGSVAMQINLQTPDEVDAAIARAAAAGATVTMPPTDTFWVMRYGRLRDPYGYVWAFGAPLPL